MKRGCITFEIASTTSSCRCSRIPGAFITRRGFMSEYFDDVKKYDAGASEEIVGKIVKHLGIALRNRDSANVAASDKTELDRVVTNWCGKKLGVTGEAAEK